MLFLSFSSSFKVLGYLTKKSSLTVKLKGQAQVRDLISNEHTVEGSYCMEKTTAVTCQMTCGGYYRLFINIGFTKYTHILETVLDISSI